MGKAKSSSRQLGANKATRKKEDLGICMQRIFCRHIELGYMITRIVGENIDMHQASRLFKKI